MNRTYEVYNRDGLYCGTAQRGDTFTRMAWRRIVVDYATNKTTRFLKQCRIVSDMMKNPEKYFACAGINTILRIRMEVIK